MPEQVVRLLTSGRHDLICDATLGSGAHAEAILDATGPGGVLIGLDRDPRALDRARVNLARFGDRVIYRLANFRNLAEVLPPVAPEGVDGVLLDLGVSSEQIDDAASGFSFMREGPLSMVMSVGHRPDAADLIRDSSVEELAAILGDFGDVRRPFRVAKAIKGTLPMKTTHDLAAAARRGGAGRPEDLARVFQALRIAVNDERGALDSALQSMEQVLRPGGCLCVISYHSGEDRMVKRFLSPPVTGKPLPWRPVERDGGAWELLARGALKPAPNEVAENSRSRSARLRAARRIGT
jgi:16S rRNA (cytosine1402-N4)-methyltransferase